jgi:hypothetical protein
MKKPRGLSDDFLKELQKGFLAPLHERVRKDPTLCMEVREDYVNIYYRGGNLLKVAQAPGGYSAAFDPNYFKGAAAPLAGLPSVIQSLTDVESWLAAFPQMKDAIDVFPKHSVEREVQQILVADNNRWGAARASDYFICDIEYANEFGRFDFVAVHWPSRPSDRKQAAGRRLVLGEVKYADSALKGKAGLREHVVGANEFLKDPSRVEALKDEMVRIFNQKRSLGLIECGKDLAGFSDEKPVLLLVLANHDPDKSALCGLLSELPDCPNADVRVASASLMGYGLFKPAVLSVEQALERIERKA